MYPHHPKYRIVIAICVVSCVCLAGCNVGWMRMERRQPQVPSHARSSILAKIPSNEGMDLQIADAREADLVEEVVAHRAAYHRSLNALQTYYAERGNAIKEGWADFELSGLRRVKAFKYILDAEVASDALRPTDSIAEADALYEKGMELMRRGGHGVPALFDRDRMVEAAATFRELIERFPSSDKIDDAAFYLGEIHKEYLPNQELLAVKWYERAWTWNPSTPHPARFQAAVVNDYRLHDRDRALELYQQVIESETGIKSNVRFAARRIHELTDTVQTAEVTAR